MAVRTDSASTLLDVAWRDVEELQRQFQCPDDDWSPVLLMRTSSGRSLCGTVIMGEDLDATVEGLRLILASLGAVEAALVTSAWVVFDPAAREIDDNVGASEDPARRECVVISYVDSERARMEVADIHRSADKPPTLGVFRGAEGFHVRCRLIDTMRRGISEPR